METIFRRRPYILSVLLLLLQVFAYAKNIDTTKTVENKIDQLVEKYNSTSSPGFSLGVVKNGKVLYSKGFGLANLEHAIPNTSTTGFNVGSNSKQFTAACIVLLAQQNKLDLDQSLCSIFPDFPVYGDSISIKHLLHHTSGLRDYLQLAYLTGLRPNDYYDDEDIFRWIKGQKKLNFIPGERYMYSNTGYWLLARIVEKISGMSIGDFSREALFIPLEMNQTLYLSNATLVVKKRALGYARNRSGEYSQILSNLDKTGDGGVYSTVEDLKKWDDEFYNRTVFNDSFWETMTTLGKLNNGKELTYAKGLSISTKNGLKKIDHGGRSPGYRSNIIRYPEERISIIILSNLSNIHPNSIAEQITNVLLKRKANKPLDKSQKEYIPITLSQDELLVYEGAFWNAKSKSKRIVKLENDTLLFVRNPFSIHPLVPVGDGMFRMLKTPPDINARATFYKEKEDFKVRVDINGERGLEYVHYKPIELGQKDLQALEGTYFSEEIKTRYTFKLIEEQLWLYINDRQIVQLDHTKDAMFNSPMCDFNFISSDEVLVSTTRVQGLKFVKK